MDTSRSCGLTLRPTDNAPCGSKATSSTRRPASASAAPRLMVEVVLPTPPFWLTMAITRAGPCEDRTGGSGNSVSGRPVGPSTAPSGSCRMVEPCSLITYLSQLPSLRGCSSSGQDYSHPAGITRISAEHPASLQAQVELQRLDSG